MNSKVALDLDGTLVSHGWTTYNPPTINHALIQQLKDQGIESISIVTNQAGIPFGYRTVASFVEVVEQLDRVLHNDYGMEIDEIQISLYHDKAGAKNLRNSCVLLSDALHVHGFYRRWVWTTEDYRKPNPAMLALCNAAEYYGDSDEDEQAASAAGVIYQKVERFVG